MSLFHKWLIEVERNGQPNLDHSNNHTEFLISFVENLKKHKFALVSETVRDRADLFPLWSYGLRHQSIRPKDVYSSIFILYDLLQDIKDKLFLKFIIHSLKLKCNKINSFNFHQSFFCVRICVCSGIVKMYVLYKQILSINV